jgi:hypothetical protein
MQHWMLDAIHNPFPTKPQGTFGNSGIFGIFGRVMGEIWSEGTLFTLIGWIGTERIAGRSDWMLIGLGLPIGFRVFIIRLGFAVGNESVGLAVNLIGLSDALELGFEVGFSFTTINKWSGALDLGESRGFIIGDTECEVCVSIGEITRGFPIFFAASILGTTSKRNVMKATTKWFTWYIFLLEWVVAEWFYDRKDICDKKVCSREYNVHILRSSWTSSCRSAPRHLTIFISNTDCTPSLNPHMLCETVKFRNFVPYDFQIREKCWYKLNFLDLH